MAKRCTCGNKLPDVDVHVKCRGCRGACEANCACKKWTSRFRWLVERLEGDLVRNSWHFYENVTPTSTRVWRERHLGRVGHSGGLNRAPIGRRLYINVLQRDSALIQCNLLNYAFLKCNSWEFRRSYSFSCCGTASEKLSKRGYRISRWRTEAWRSLI